MSLTNPLSTISLPFSIPLPDTLPSSFIYCGEELSVMTVIYTLTTKFIGLVGQPNSPPQGNLLYKDEKVVTIRAVDPLPKINVQQEATGNLKGIFNKSAGTCIFSG